MPDLIKTACPSTNSYYRKRVCSRYDRTSISIGEKWVEVKSYRNLYEFFFSKPFNKYTEHAKPSKPPVAEAKLIVSSNLAQTRLRYRKRVCSRYDRTAISIGEKWVETYLSPSPLLLTQKQQ